MIGVPAELERSLISERTRAEGRAAPGREIRAQAEAYAKANCLCSKADRGRPAPGGRGRPVQGQSRHPVPGAWGSETCKPFARRETSALNAN
jgi:hypothetical protein